MPAREFDAYFLLGFVNRNGYPGAVRAILATRTKQEQSRDASCLRITFTGAAVPMVFAAGYVQSAFLC